MKPKILFFDIETSPSLGFSWGKWEQNIIKFKEHWFILSYSAKWFNGKQTTRGLIDYPRYRNHKHSDKAIVKDMWDLFDKADILIAHNGDQFDIKKVSAKFSYHGLPPPSPYVTVDTKKIAKRYFGFLSNSLDDLGDYLRLGRKVHHEGFELWEKCMAGDSSAWRRMKKYNAQDVLLLERIYQRFLPFMKNHPNMGAWTKNRVCPKCGSVNVHSRGYEIVPSGRYQRLQCHSCGAWSREVKNRIILR